MIPSRRAAFALVVLVAAALSFLSGLLGPDSRRTDAGQPAVFAIDADPSGNSETSIGTIDECTTVSQGTFDVDVVVENVDDLLAWESLLAYDDDILRITEIDVRQFLDVDPGSTVVNVSASLPDASGSYYMGAGDVGAERDSGSGVLARLTLEATHSGVSPLELATRDVDGDTSADLGPTLSGLSLADQVTHIGDADGDELFDDPTNARVAVDTPCPAPSSPGGGGRGGDDGSGDGSGGSAGSGTGSGGSSAGSGSDGSGEDGSDGQPGAAGGAATGGGSTPDDTALASDGDGSDSDEDSVLGSGASGDNGGDGIGGIDIGRSGGGDDWPLWLIALIVGAPLAFGVGLLALWRWRRADF